MLGREACCSILTFLTRLFEPKLLLACSPEAATIVRSPLSDQGACFPDQSCSCDTAQQAPPCARFVPAPADHWHPHIMFIMWLVQRVNLKHGTSDLL